MYKQTSRFVFTLQLDKQSKHLKVLQEMGISSMIKFSDNAIKDKLYINFDVQKKLVF